MRKIPPSISREWGATVKTLMESFQTLSFAPEEVVGSLKEKDNLKKLVQQMEKVVMKIVKLRSAEGDREGET